MKPIEMTAARKNQYAHSAVVVLVFALAAYYRLHELDRLSLWADELWGAIACTKETLRAMISDLITRDNHPPGYQTLQYVVMRWFGHSETVIRLPSAIGGILTVIAVYIIGKKLISKETGLMAALLLAGSYQHIVYSQEARAYVLLGLAALLGFYFFARLFIQEHIKNTSLFGMIASMTACLYLHYAGTMFVGLLFGGWIICALASSQKKVLIMSGLYVFGLTAVLFYQWVPVMIAHMNVSGFYWAKSPTPASIVTTIEFLLGPDRFRVAWQLLVLVVGGCSIVYKRDTNSGVSAERKKLVLLATYIVVMSIGLVYMKSVYSSSIYTNRYFIFLIPLLCLLTGYFMDELTIRIKNHRRTIVAMLLVGIASSQLFTNQSIYTERFEKQDFRGAVAGLASLVQGRSPDEYLVVGSHEFFDFYLNEYHIKPKADAYLLFPREVSGVAKLIESARPDYIYHLEVTGEESTPVSTRLDTLYVSVSLKRFDGINLRVYRRIQKTQQPMYSVEALQHKAVI